MSKYNNNQKNKIKISSTVHNTFNRQTIIANSQRDITNINSSQERDNIQHNQPANNTVEGNNSNISNINNNSQSQIGYTPDSNPIDSIAHVESDDEDNPREPWGDELRTKTSGIVRLAFRNIDHMPENRNSP